MSEWSILIHVPEDWSERVATLLAERLVEKELPPDLTVQLGYPKHESMAYLIVREWQTK